VSTLPNNWLSLPLGEVVQLQKGRKPSNLGLEDTLRNIPYINIAVFEGKPIKEFAPVQDIPMCEPSDTLLVWDGARAGLCGRGVTGFIGSTLMRVRSDCVESSYLYYFLHAQYGILNTQTKGVGIPHIDPVIFNSIGFSLPPTKEQARIVTKLEELFSELDAGVAELKAAQKKLGQYRQSLLKAAVEGALTEQWRKQNTPKETGAQLLERILTERRTRWETKQLAKFKEQDKAPPKDWKTKYPEPVLPNIVDLPALPKNWTWASVDQCSLDEMAITDGPFGSNLKSSHYQENGPRVIRLQNIGDGVFVDARAHISTAHYLAMKKHAVEENDVLMAMLGETLPRACIVPAGVSPAIVKADCARIRVNNEILSPSLLMSQLNSKPIRDFVVKFIKGIGRPRINLGHIRTIPIAVCGIEEQRIIESELVDKSKSIDSQLLAIDLALKQSAAQRQNILKSAFSGQLVPQNQEDEPASELLKRIRAERDLQAKQPKVKKVKVKKEISVMSKKLIDVLTEADDWITAQDAFRLCGIADQATTEQIEEIYKELRELDQSKQLLSRPIKNARGVKKADELKLVKKI
jgi:type I restriction enzyme S subunit